MVRRLSIVCFCALAWASFISSASATTATTTATISVFAAITLSPSPLSFGNQQVGQQATKILTVTNAGTTAFNNFSITLLPGLNSGTFSLSNDCGAALAAGASCQISVAYLPIAAANANAAVQFSGAGHAYTASVSGTGISAPPPPTPVSITLTPPSIQVLNNATGGSILSRATVTMSDGTTNFTGTLITSDTHYFQISGLNVVLAHDLSPADDGQHVSTISIGP